MPIDWNHVIEQSLSQAPAIMAGAAAIIVAARRRFNRLEANQARIEKKADGQHEAVREEIKKAGRYEGAQEAKQDSRIDREQIVKAVEQVLVAQSKLRGRRRSDG